MAINTSDTFLFKIDPVDFALFQASEQPSTSPDVETQITSQNQDVFVSFINDIKSVFANDYPCQFEFGGKYYSSATDCFLAHTDHINQLDVMMHVQRAKFGQNPELKKQLLATGNAFLVCQDNDLLGICLMRLRGEYGCTGIVEPGANYRCHLAVNFPNIINLISSYPDIIHQIFSQCVCMSNFGGLFAWSCLNHQWNQCSIAFWDRFDLKQICPTGLNIIDAERLGVKVDDEPPINVRAILKAFKELASGVKDDEGLTLLTMYKGLSINGLVQIAADKGMKIVFGQRDKILAELGAVAVDSTYRVLMTNNIFWITLRETHDRQKILVAQYKCEMPPAQEYIALCVFTRNLFDRCLFGKIEGSSSTHALGDLGDFLDIGECSRDCLCVFLHDDYLRGSIGSAGRRQF